MLLFIITIFIIDCQHVWLEKYVVCVSMKSMHSVTGTAFVQPDVNQSDLDDT